MKTDFRILMLLSLLLFASCEKERLAGDTHATGEEIVFSLTDESPSFSASVSTRATPVTSLSSVKVTATRGDAGSETSYFENVAFTKDGYWYKAGRVWPMVDRELHFYASNVDMTFDAAGCYIDVTTATDALVGYVPSPAIAAPNGIAMRHVWSRIRNVTVTRRDDCALSGVRVRIVPKTGGRYNLRTGEWSGVATGSSTDLATATGTTANDLWLLPGTYFVLTSWTATKDALTETFTDVPYLMTFEAGRQYDFALALNSVMQDVSSVSVDVPSVTYSFDGTPVGSDAFTVESKTSSALGEKPEPWRTAVETSPGTWTPLSDAVLLPQFSWLSGFPSGNAAPAATTTVCDPSVPAQAVISHEERLKSLTIADGSSVHDNGEESGAVDLSFYDHATRSLEAARYTSNCYVVSSPGWYEFPLVYGNAIENGAENSSAYSSSSSGTGHLNSFKNYKYDLPISSPWIEQDWKTWLVSRNSVASVAVVWQRWSRWNAATSSVVTENGDQGVVSDLQIVSGADGRYVRFRISPDNIRPGNFLVAALDEGGDASDDEGDDGQLTIWSWHIWVTAQDLDPVTVNNGSASFGVLPVNTGWTDGTKGLWYEGRSASLRFELVSDPDVHSSVLSVTQDSHTAESVTGWGPYYQWGRKDPFIPGLYAFKDDYDMGIRGAVRHPDWLNSEVSHYFSDAYYDWSTNNYDNLWDCNWTSYGVTSAALPVRTVMDPSPRRCCVAPDLAWSGFPSYGHEGAFDGGYHFYTDSGMTDTVFFPACGYIGVDGIQKDASDNRYWTLHAWNSLQRRASYGLRFTSSTVENAYYSFNHRAYGQPVRSVSYN